MNKTLSVNIGGIVFHIEEHAFERLTKYLDTIKGYFTTADGRDEIIQDIEGRIAEMFQERISNSKQVIVEADVEQVINIMGRPEQFAGDGEEEPAAATGGPSASSERRAYRRLYRDPDDRVVGGVCSGFSHYLGIDPTYLRVAFAISFFVFGTGLLLYIILMVVMPKANTTAEKLEMKGEQVNISNIKKSVQDEYGAIKNQYSSGGNQSGFTRFIDALGQLFVGFFRLFGQLIAVIFIIIGILLLIAFGAVAMALMGVGGIAIPFFVTDLFLDPWQQTMALTAVFLVIGIPVMMIIYKAIKVLFKIRSESKILNWSALALWVCGVILSFFVGSIIARDFSQRETSRFEVELATPATDTLFLDMARYERSEDYYIYDSRERDAWSVISGMDSISIDEVELDIIKGGGTEFELVQINSSRGRTRRDAVDNARALSYHLEQTDSLIKFDESFILTKGMKFRGQKVQLVLKVPVGKSVYLSESMHDIIYDVKNVTNTYDGDMVGHTWTMTPEGLECIGCTFKYEKRNSRTKRSDDIKIKIDGNGVRVRGVQDGDSAINVDAEDVDISINETGVSIDAKQR